MPDEEIWSVSWTDGRVRQHKPFKGTNAEKRARKYADRLKNEGILAKVQRVQ